MKNFPLDQNADSNMLMVGCGNSKLSEEMANAGYHHITNCDISDNVILKMRNFYNQKFPLQEFAVIDATRMAYRDNTFDLCIDKGTFDALACGSDTEIPLRLVKEMMRVCSKATVIITSGGPEKRLGIFEKACSNIHYERIEVSKLAQLINILRTELGNKPLSEALKGDSKVLKDAMEELVAIERIKRLEQEAKTDLRKKLALLMYKAKRKMDLEAKVKK
jgi:ubiquinone/menaquinone biosynthesis C-methylase UbiE